MADVHPPESGRQITPKSRMTNDRCELAARALGADTEEERSPMEMPATNVSRDPKIPNDPLLHRVLADVGRTRSEVERFQGDSILDKTRLFPQVEDGEPSRRLIGYLSGPGLGEINLADAAPIGSMLDAIGMCDNLDLMLNSPGGSGEMAEKVIEMCREHCRDEFRVVVP